MSRWLPHPVLSLLLAAIWLLLVNTLSLGQALLGLLLGWVIVLLCRDYLLPVPRVRRPLLLCRLILRVLGDILMANLHVARLVLGPLERLRPAFVEVPLALEDEFLLAVLASIVSLTPGTVSVVLTLDRKTLLLHGLDVPDAEVLIAEVKSRYEAPLLEIFACSPP